MILASTMYITPPRPANEVTIVEHSPRNMLRHQKTERAKSKDTALLLVINCQNTASPCCLCMRSGINGRATGCADAIEPLVAPQQPAEQHRCHLQREVGDPHVPCQ